MSRSDRDRQRAAEREAARFLGEEPKDVPRESDSEDRDRGVFASQLFIDGLLQSWARGGREESIAKCEARVARTVGALGEPARVRGSNRRALFALAACLIIGASIAALWFLPRGRTGDGADPVRDTIDETLVRIDPELDAVYEGAFAIEFAGRPIDLPLKLVSGPDRHRVELQTMFGELSLGAAHGRRWFVPPGADEAVDVSDRHAEIRGDLGSGMRRRMHEMFQLDWLQDVGGLLRLIRRDFAIDEEPAADGLIRLRATPREDGRATGIESLDVTVRQATFRVESFSVTMARRDDLPMMFPMPVRVRLDFVKAYHAPGELFWPAGLGPRPGAPTPERDR